MLHSLLIASVAAIAFGRFSWHCAAVAQTPTADSLNLKEQQAKMFSKSARYERYIERWSDLPSSQPYQRKGRGVCQGSGDKAISAVSKSGAATAPGLKNYVQFYVGNLRPMPRHAYVGAMRPATTAHSCDLCIGVDFCLNDRPNAVILSKFRTCFHWRALI